MLACASYQPYASRGTKCVSSWSSLFIYSVWRDVPRPHEPNRRLDGPTVYIVWTHRGIYSLVLMAYICRYHPHREGGRERSGTRPTSAACSNFSTLFWLYRILISPSAVYRYTNAMLGGRGVHGTQFHGFVCIYRLSYVSVL